MENEKASRAIAKKSVGQDMLEAERLPFLCSERKDIITKPAPCVFIADLQAYIMDLLEEYEV